MKTMSMYIVLVCFCAFAKAQNTASDALVVEDRQEIKLGVGDRQEINTIEITFLEVLEDSRCPKDVSCVWAGQAKIKVLIKEKGKPSVEKEFIFDASGKNVFIHKSETVIIEALRLSPYPKTSLAISKRVYYLELQA